MKATGIIVEYNPFHNGHLHHVQQAKNETDADIIIAVMSGNFLQRGEPAFIDKWSRAKMALQNEVDIVFELPYAFATAHAPEFARGAIRILDASLCSAYCFGSEDGQIKPFERAMLSIQQAGPLYDQHIKQAVQKGISYPKALNEAYQKAIESSSSVPPADLTKPNNILGFHYMQAADELQSAMKAATIPRIVAGYHDDALLGNSIASATGIRKSFFTENAIQAVTDFLPSASKHILTAHEQKGASFGDWHSFYPLLRFLIIREGPDRLHTIADITEGIENLLYKAALSSETFETFMQQVKTKRYTWTRIQRMLTHIFTGFTYEMRARIESPSYLRLLGMSPDGQRYLNIHKKQLKLPLISKAAGWSDPSLQMDIKASDMYALGISRQGSPAELRSDFQQRPIIT